MKVSPELYTILRDGVRNIVEYHGKEKVLDTYKENTLNRLMHDMLGFALFDFNNSDEHPAFKNGRQRVNPQREQFLDIYENEVNDDHITTALKKIAKELGLHTNKGK